MSVWDVVRASLEFTLGVFAWVFLLLVVAGAVILIFAVLVGLVRSVRAAATPRPRKSEYDEVYRTLGDIAEELKRMRADGMTKESIEYALTQVFYK
jgi:hypothetical protein